MTAGKRAQTKRK